VFEGYSDLQEDVPTHKIIKDKAHKIPKKKRKERTDRESWRVLFDAEAFNK
jgi:hypothetical protein